MPFMTVLILMGLHRDRNSHFRKVEIPEKCRRDKLRERTVLIMLLVFVRLLSALSVFWFFAILVALVWPICIPVRLQSPEDCR
jgi:hypothetical protein